jgi:uncharacterized membrane protein YoaK (UPF0700 family)
LSDSWLMDGTRITDPLATSLPFALLLTLANSFLDSYTYLVRGQVFATAQTGNVVFFALKLSDQQFAAALAHVWPILAFVAGVGIAAHLKSGRMYRHLRHPLRWAIGLQALVLGVIGLVPASVASSAVTIPISFVAALQIGLFRSIGDLAYVPIATTGNLMRLVESGYSGFIDNRAEPRRATGVYSSLIATFVVGALLGAVFTRLSGTHAIWMPATVLVITLAMLLIDDQRRSKKAMTRYDSRPDVPSLW